MANNGNSQWGKWMVILIIVVGLAGAIAWHVFGRGSNGPQYLTADVTRGDVIQAVTATGTLTPLTNVTVGSQISGNIQKLLADWNSPVKANQIVAEIDPATYKAAVEQAQGDLASAEANSELDQVQAKRADEMFKDKLISDSDHDTAIATYHQAQATVKMKQAALDNAKVNLDRCTIYSPVDGIVISRNVDVGQTVAASMSAPTLFVIANDLSKMQIDANVAEADVGGIEVGQHVDFHVDAYPYRTFVGTVEQIRNAPTNYQNVVAYDTVISVNNSDMKLKPGMTATVSIVIAGRTNVLQVENSAFRVSPVQLGLGKPSGTGAMPTNTAGAQPSGIEGGHQGGGGHGPAGGKGGGGHAHSGRPPVVRTVYVLPDKADKDAKPKPVQVKVGISDGIYTEIVDGLKEGDQVISGVVQDQAGGSSGGRPFGFGRGRF